jgi:hypothetical protein
MLKGIASLSIEIAKMILPTSQIAAASIATMSAWTLGLGVAAIIGGLIAGVSAINSATKSNISVRQASGGGINSIPSQNNISTPSQNQQQNSNTEITVNFGGNTYAKINTQNNKSQTSYA